MTDRQAFIDAIIADPDNDLPRLVFADWLDEHGETERAEFIRVQIALYNFLFLDSPKPEHVTWLNGNRTRGLRQYRQWEPLRRRESELIGPANQFAGEFLDHDPLPAWSGDSGYGWHPTPTSFIFAHFSRGFVSEILRVTSADWLIFGDGLVAVHPITSVCFVDALLMRNHYLAHDWDEITKLRWPRVREWRLPDDDIRASGIAGEAIRAGHYVGMGNDGLLYRTNATPIGVALNGANEGEMLAYGISRVWSDSWPLDDMPPPRPIGPTFTARY